MSGNSLFNSKSLDLDSGSYNVGELTIRQVEENNDVIFSVLEKLGKGYSVREVLEISTSDPFIKLVSVSCKKSVDELKQIPPREYDILAMTFWRVNSDFLAMRRYLMDQVTPS